ncbi:Trypsin [Mycobacteroides abscessus subsp. abscessus]|nr:hypothetical protein AWC10_16195 [Mycobacteroides immunogenum]SID67260.1 Trypsin [Mycobacteroides abscessus subsp. abscessus]SIF71069.1 Trypsin [Mycobacteroides abscessus subsp. abscessus]SIF74682.1 Trypsin [Mycobacteroides abscessus subsp. abscessus]SIF78888.1 Trypsin [Mycobacteroides abscessus subsp. abscessus]
MGEKRCIAGLSILLVGAAAVMGVPAAVARATVNMAPGMAIVIADHECSLGFFASNASNDNLAVTAGHCADRPDQIVRTEDGIRIGTVVLWKPDQTLPNGKIDDLSERGFTVIDLDDARSVNPFFATVGTVSEGDAVTLAGTTSGIARGRVTSAGASLLAADIKQQPGDSGGPWYTSGPTLVGIASSGDKLASGRYDAQAQPIRDIVHHIRNSGSKWGRGFKVWSVR